MSRKKYFSFLYISNNINDNIIEIKLDKPITYKDYFCLTKLIHSAFINFQFGINNFIATSYNSIFLSLSNPMYCSSHIQKIEDISFLQIKRCLTALKKYAIKNFKIIRDYKEAINNELILNFIEDLANDDIRYKNSSIRQIKSHYIRQCQLHKKKYCDLISEEIFVDSTSLILKYYNEIKCIRSTQYSSSPANTEVPLDMTTSDQIQHTETSTLIDFDLYSIIQQTGIDFTLN